MTVRESGKWQGRGKLSKRGSGALRRCLFLAALGSLRGRTASAFGAYYRTLEARGLRGYRALMAVMRKMLVVAYHLLKHGGHYDPAKVWRGVAAVEWYSHWISWIIPASPADHLHARFRADPTPVTGLCGRRTRLRSFFTGRLTTVEPPLPTPKLPRELPAGAARAVRVPSSADV